MIEPEGVRVLENTRKLVESQPAKDDWSAGAVIHRWLVREFPEFSHCYMTKTDSGNALIHDACSYLWRDLPNSRQGASLFYDGMRVSYNLWHAKPGGSTLKDGEFDAVLADPEFFAQLKKALDEDLQSNSHLYRPPTRPDQEDTGEAWDQTSGSGDAGESPRSA